MVARLIRDAIQDMNIQAPHVVLLGSGASKAAFPEGDAAGRIVPIMKELIDVLALRSSIDEAGLTEYADDFEGFYNALCQDSRFDELRIRVEQAAVEYFSELEMPDTPTLYDHLVLSLRAKDVIATFNWDPFLWRACARNAPHADLPRTIYLHGNVEVGYCPTDAVKGAAGGRCATCQKEFRSSRLLYPVAEKNYTDDPVIRDEWRDMRTALKAAYVFTIFGYGAPETDVEALSLLQDAWGDTNTRTIEQIELVNIESQDTLVRKWGSLLHHWHGTPDHVVCTESFYDTVAAHHPRRSCEANSAAHLMLDPHGSDPIPRNSDFERLWDWVGKYVVVERAGAS